MVDAVRTWLGQQGVTPTNFYYEKFAPSGAAAPLRRYGPDHFEKEHET
jgi:hypothetical protein